MVVTIVSLVIIKIPWNLETTKSFGVRIEEVYRKYMRDVRRNSPEKFCKMQYDKLVVEDRVFVFR